MTFLSYEDNSLLKRIQSGWKQLPLFPKLMSLFIFAYYGVLGSLQLLIILIVSPILRVRIGRISSNRIGHFILEYDWYFSFLRMPRRTGWRIHLDIFFYGGDVCNNYLDKLWRRRALIAPRSVIYPLYALLRLIPRLSKLLVTLPSRPTDFSTLDGLPSSIIMTEAETKFGSELMLSLGIKEDSKLVCLYVRDSSYAESLGLETKQASYRDSKIENYLPLIEYLVSQGYFVVRMGTVARGSIELDTPMFLDYVNSATRSDFLDFFISSKCELAISTDSGMMQFPIAFRKALGLVNVPAYHGIISGKCLTLFQFTSFVDTTSRRELNLKELRERGFEDVDNLEGFLALGISHIENSASELVNFGVELIDFLEDPSAREANYVEIKNSFNRISNLEFSTTQTPRLSLNWCKNHPKFLLGS